MCEIIEVTFINNGYPDFDCDNVKSTDALYLRVRASFSYEVGYTIVTRWTIEYPDTHREYLEQETYIQFAGERFIYASLGNLSSGVYIIKYVSISYKDGGLICSQVVT